MPDVLAEVGSGLVFFFFDLCDLGEGLHGVLPLSSNSSWIVILAECSSSSRFFITISFLLHSFCDVRSSFCTTYNSSFSFVFSAFEIDSLKALARTSSLSFVISLSFTKHSFLKARRSPRDLICASSIFCDGLGEGRSRALIVEELLLAVTSLKACDRFFLPSTPLCFPLVEILGVLVEMDMEDSIVLC